MDPNITAICPPIQTYFSFTPRNVYYDYYLIFLVAVTIFMAITITSSNFIIIVTFLKTPSLKTPSNFLLLGLAMTDFVTGILVLPSFTMYKLSEYQRNVESYCLSGMIFTSVGAGLSVISFMILSTVSADRYLAVCLHLRYDEFVTTKRYAVLIILYWASNTVISFLRAYNVNLIIFGVLFLVVTLTMDAFFLFKIAQTIHKHSVQIQAQHQNANHRSQEMARLARNVKFMYYIIGAFILCYLPIMSMMIVCVIYTRFNLHVRVWFSVAGDAGFERCY